MCKMKQQTFVRIKKKKKKKKILKSLDPTSYNLWQ